MTNFVFKNLKEITSRVKVGFVGPVNEFYCDKEAGVPIVRTTDIDDIDFGKLKFVTKDFHEKNKKSQVKKGDLIIARHGDNGNAVIYKHNRSAQVLNAVIIEPDQSKVSSDLLKIFFDSPFIKKQIKGAVKGSVQGVINTKHISDLILNFSEAIDYDFVTKIITNLDQKIELNYQINAKLEEMAKLIYDYWFVQFDFPDENGKPYKSSGGKMVYNEKLDQYIPENWTISSIKEWFNSEKSGDWGKETAQNNFTLEVCCIRGTDLSGLSGEGEEKAPIRFINKNNRDKILSNFDLVVEISGGSPTQSTGRIAAITPELQNRFQHPLVCSNFCKPISINDSDYFYNFLYLWRSFYNSGLLFKWEGKTSGIKNLLFENFVNNHKTTKPPKDIAKNFNNLISPLEEKKQFLLNEITVLKYIRNWLLPMLMNGQVKSI